MMRRVNKPWRAVILAVAMLALLPDRAVAAGMDDPATADEVQRQMEALAQALAEARKTDMTTSNADTANVQDLQALTEALTGVSGQLAGAMAGDTTAERDLQTLLGTLQQQAARQQALKQQRLATPKTTP